MATMYECGKCGRKFSWAPAKGKHEKSCQGKADGGDGSVQENPDLPMPEVRKPRKAKRTGRRGGARKAKGGGGVIGNVVQMLKDKRDERVATLVSGDEEVQQYDTAIQALEGRPS